MAAALSPAAAWAALAAPTSDEASLSEEPNGDSAAADAEADAAQADDKTGAAPAGDAAPDSASTPIPPATSGARVLVGLSHIRAEALGVRLDLGWQMAWGDRIAWRGYLASLYHYESVSIPDLSGLTPDLHMELHELALLATAEIDVGVHASDMGRLGVGGGLGIGPSFAWVKTPDMPFRPGEWTHASAVLGRLSGHIEYRFDAGWVLHGQPFGLIFSGHDDTDVAYEMAIMGGYQW